MGTTRSTPVWPAYGIALVALFCGLGGPSYAAGLVTGADIRDGSVASIDLKDNSTKGVDIKNGSLGVVDLATAAKAELLGACGAGQELQWLVVGLEAAGQPVDQTVRIARCVGTGAQVMGNGIVEPPEECDDADMVSGDGCSAAGMLEGSASLNYRPSGQLHYQP